jgi:hypothetical protein
MHDRPIQQSSLTYTSNNVGLYTKGGGRSVDIHGIRNFRNKHLNTLLLGDEAIITNSEDKLQAQTQKLNKFKCKYGMAISGDNEDTTETRESDLGRVKDTINSEILDANSFSCFGCSLSLDK